MRDIILGIVVISIVGSIIMLPISPGAKLLIGLMTALFGYQIVTDDVDTGGMVVPGGATVGATVPAAAAAAVVPPAAPAAVVPPAAPAAVVPAAAATAAVVPAARTAATLAPAASVVAGTLAVTNPTYIGARPAAPSTLPPGMDYASILAAAQRRAHANRIFPTRAQMSKYADSAKSVFLLLLSTAAVSMMATSHNNELYD